MTHEQILACWLSEQIDPAEMVQLCRDDPALEAMILERAQ